MPRRLSQCSALTCLPWAHALQVKAKLEGGIDPSTGKKMFVPRTGRSPAFSRNTGGLPVGDYLYGIASNMAQKKVSCLGLQCLNGRIRVRIGWHEDAPFQPQRAVWSRAFS